jgi:hypothetical protein
MNKLNEEEKVLSNETRRKWYDKNKNRINETRRKWKEKKIENLSEEEILKIKNDRKEYDKKRREMLKETLTPEQKEELKIKKNKKAKERRKNNQKYKEYSKNYIKSLSKEKRYQNNKKYYDSLTPEQKEERRLKNNQRQKERREKDPLYKLKGNVSSLIRQSIKLKGYIKESKTHEILGCSLEDFKIHLENQFTDWMNWENYGNPVDGLIEPNKTWDIDHIIPLVNATGEEELLKLNHYTNLQPLCSYQNRFIKKDNY